MSSQSTDWDDGTVNHAASKDWNSGARQAKGSVVSSQSSDEVIEAKIAPIITRTYGDNGMSRALVAHMAPTLAAENWDERGREHYVMQTCWLWFPGGTTAASVAAKVEEALR